jgi:outer membrane protein OmpA-like peptidoglycan-associated protein
MSKWILALALAALLAAPALADSGERAAKRAQAGEVVHDLSWPWPFGKVSTDSDGDGVFDDKDTCPDTPKGATVDAKGCPQDADGDGVFDGIDMCANTPKGAKVDAKGCPTDADGDGVFDGLDRCPGTPKGAKVDANGCPQDTDGDGDGVMDSADKCPGTPKGATVDAKGCPSDADGDGVFDGIDKCANTPAGTKVDAKGCPVNVTETETQFLDTGMIRTSLIRFDTDKATIKPESHKALDEIGGILVQWPQLKIEIAGHTDSKGGDAHNQTLSQARAQAVLEYLTKNFPKISASQYTVKGYGETKPVADNGTVEGRAANRRVEFTVLNKEELKKEVEKRKN